MGHHQSVLQALVKELRDEGIEVVHIFGSDNASARTAAVDDFQKGSAQVFVGSIAAAGVGITLTAASDMLIVERVWRPGDLVQAEDRIHRIGQSRGVTITYMDCENSIDRRLASLLADKTKTSASVIDGINLDDDGAVAVVLGEMFRPEALTSNPSRGEIVWVPTGDWTDPLAF
jgi:SWI/SNF-related matrix-associated actin-dependent regulator 1 of chromatin subfamily A